MRTRLQSRHRGTSLTCRQMQLHWYLHLHPDLACDTSSLVSSPTLKEEELRRKELPSSDVTDKSGGIGAE